MTRRKTSINIRITSKLRDLIDRAARLTGKTRSAFILDCARTRAVDVILDQRLFLLDIKQYDNFLRTLDSPSQSIPQLKKLLEQRP